MGAKIGPCATLHHEHLFMLPKKRFLVLGFFGRTTERDSELHINSCRKTVVHFSICACHPRAGAMLIFASLFLTSLFFASLFFAPRFFAFSSSHLCASHLCFSHLCSSHVAHLESWDAGERE